MEFFGGVGGDPLKPSLFELVAQEQLGDLLQQALRQILVVSMTFLVWDDSNLHLGLSP